MLDWIELLRSESSLTLNSTNQSVQQVVLFEELNEELSVALPKYTNHVCNASQEHTFQD